MIPSANIRSLGLLTTLAQVRASYGDIFLLLPGMTSKVFPRRQQERPLRDAQKPT